MKILLATLVALVLVGSTYADKPFNAEIQAIRLISQFDKFVARPYVCPGGKLTIGYGFTDKSIVSRGYITRKEADRILGQKVRSELVWVQKKFPKLTPHKQVAVVSFVYNVGQDRLLWKKVKGKRVHTNLYWMLVAGDYRGAAKAMSNYIHADGEVSAGLMRRRSAEISYLLK